MRFIRKLVARWTAKKITDRLSAAERKTTISHTAALGMINEALNRTHEKKTIKIVPPYILPRVVPNGQTAIVCDSNEPCYDSNLFDILSDNPYMQGGFQPFPGFQYLAQLCTQVEYFNLHKTIADEATREWIEIIANDANDAKVLDRIKKIETEFTKFGIRSLIHKAIGDDAKFGRAQIFIDNGAKGDKLKLPLLIDPAAIPINSIRGFKCVEAFWTTPVIYNSIEPQADDFYRPVRWFMIGQEVHYTRLMTIVTHELPDILKPAYNFAGMSLSQLCQPYINNWLETRQATNQMLAIYSTTGLATDMGAILQGDEVDGDELKKLIGRVEMFTLNRDNSGCMIFDKDHEDIKQLNAPLTGLDKMQSQSQEQICAASRTPAVKYLGTSALGLNASDEGSLKAYYDSTHAYQVNHWLKPLTTILKIIQLNMDGVIDDNIYIKFRSLMQNNDHERAVIRMSDTKRDVALVTAGILSKLEVRGRLSHDPDSAYTNINPDEVPELEEQTDPSEDEGNDPQKTNKIKGKG